MKKGIFRYRIITNLNCNMNESTGVNGNCYFCYQKFKSPLRLDCDKMEDTLKKVGVLKRATIMGGESLLNPELVKIVKIVSDYTSEGICLVTNGILLNRDIIVTLKDAAYFIGGKNMMTKALELHVKYICDYDKRRRAKQ